MFFGTKWYYKFLYFVTAMTPAYMLFYFQILQKFKLDNKIVISLLNIRFTIYWSVCILVILLSLVLFLKFLLKKQFLQGYTDRVLSSELYLFKEKNLQHKNGNVISFLLGNILPAVYIVENSLSLAITSFIILQIMIFIILIRSTDVFPNVLLIIFGVDLCVTQDERYVFIFRSRNIEEFKVYQIGNQNKSKTYITIYPK